MTPRERMIATLEHRRPDQAAAGMWCRPEVMANLRAHYGVESDQEVAEILGADMTRRVSIKTHWPDFDPRANAEHEGERWARRADHV